MCGEHWADDEGLFAGGVWVRGRCVCGEAESGGTGGGDRALYEGEGGGKGRGIGSGGVEWDVGWRQDEHPSQNSISYGGTTST